MKASRQFIPVLFEAKFDTNAILRAPTKFGLNVYRQASDGLLIQPQEA